ISEGFQWVLRLTTLVAERDLEVPGTTHHRVFELLRTLRDPVQFDGHVRHVIPQVRGQLWPAGAVEAYRLVNTWNGEQPHLVLGRGPVRFYGMPDPADNAYVEGVLRSWIGDDVRFRPPELRWTVFPTL